MSVARDEMYHPRESQESPSVPDITEYGKDVDELMQATHKAFLAFIGQVGAPLDIIRDASPLARRQYDESVGGTGNPDAPWWNQ